jgi:hypothetical protein
VVDINPAVHSAGMNIYLWIKSYIFPFQYVKVRGIDIDMWLQFFLTPELNGRAHYM